MSENPGYYVKYNLRLSDSKSLQRAPSMGRRQGQKLLLDCTGIVEFGQLRISASRGAKGSAAMELCGGVVASEVPLSWRYALVT